MITWDQDVEHEKDNGKKSENTKTTGANEKPLTSYPNLEEQHEEPYAYMYFNVQTKVSNTIHTQDNASEEDLTIALEHCINYQT